MTKILTEEELRGIDVYNDTNTYEATVIDKLVNSHRLLLSANAELSFSNMLLKAAYNKLLKETNPCKTQSLYPSLNTEP